MGRAWAGLSCCEFAVTVWICTISAASGVKLEKAIGYESWIEAQLAVMCRCRRYPIVCFDFDSQHWPYYEMLCKQLWIFLPGKPRRSFLTGQYGIRMIYDSLSVPKSACSELVRLPVLLGLHQKPVSPASHGVVQFTPSRRRA